jgi:hypothetical protein
MTESSRRLSLEAQKLQSELAELGTNSKLDDGASDTISAVSRAQQAQSHSREAQTQRDDALAAWQLHYDLWSTVQDAWHQERGE